MDKHYRKSYRLNGHPNSKLGIPLGIHDKNGEELHSGDEILYNNRECIVLYNASVGTWDAMITDSMWYYNKDKYDYRSYGKSWQLHMDDGARMNIVKIAEKEEYI